MDNPKESAIRIKFIKELRASGVKYIKTEFHVDQGRIDIVTEYEIIEVKNATNWKNALGQILSYSTDSKVRDLNKRIHLFGKLNVQKNIIENTCNLYNVRISYDDGIEELVCIENVTDIVSLCEFCNTCFSTRSLLNNHQRTKICLSNPKRKVIYSKQSHEVCKDKILEYEKKIQERDIQIKERDIQIKELDKLVINMKSHSDKLTAKLELYEREIEFYKQQMNTKDNLIVKLSIGKYNK